MLVVVGVHLLQMLPKLEQLLLLLLLLPLMLPLPVVKLVRLTKIVITAPTRHAKRYCDLDGLLPRYLILHDFRQLLLILPLPVVKLV